jgi:hypothetical protein
VKVLVRYDQRVSSEQISVPSMVHERFENIESVGGGRQSAAHERSNSIEGNWRIKNVR